MSEHPLQISPQAGVAGSGRVQAWTDSIFERFSDYGGQLVARTVFSKRWTVFLFLLVVLWIVPRAEAGTITGEVRILVESHASHAPRSPFARRRPVEESSQTQMPSEEMQKVIVFLADDSSLNPAQPLPEKPIVNQKDLEIQPGFLLVPVGTTVRFPNSDDVYHNLFSVSSAKRFDLGRYGQGKEKEVIFDKPGEVRIFCDIHPHMNAIIFVVPNEYYTVLGDDGSFSLDNVPAGEYELHVWHESLGEQTKRVNVPDSGVSTVDFVFARN
ncbi:hypothetical protein KQI52_07105 [bacterium]|nr:hypothetical protein [bacterium]